MNFPHALLWIRWWWVVIVALAVVLNGWTTREAWVDQKWVHRNRTLGPAHRIRASQSVRSEAAKMVFQAGVLFVRLWETSCPLPEHAHVARCWALGGGMITALQILLALNSLLNLRDRRRVIGLLK